MHIKLINKKITFKNYKIKCSIGKTGINSKKREGDGSTPSGVYKFNLIFYRKDRFPNFKSKINKFPIKKNMGWCDDPSSKYYNKLIKFPFKYKAEKLYKKENIYDVIIVMNYNSKPIVKNKGSAIFLHVATRNYKPTQGCIAVSKKDIKTLISYIDKKTKLSIN